MPADRLRSNNAQGRQKSCSECAKSKRRCNQSQPCCTRCRKQDLRCVYPQMPSQLVDSTIRDESTEPELIPDDELFPVAMLNEPGVGALDFDFPSANQSVDTLNDLLGGDVEAMELTPMPTSPNYRVGKQFTAAQVSSQARSRVEYSMQQLKLAPAMMVKENCTHWCHPQLYADDMPRCVQDAQAACALYISRNEINATVVARHVTERTKELLDTPITHSPTQLLARTHALLLYQIIHFFNDDIRYHAYIDVTTKALEEAGYALHSMIQSYEDPSGPIQLYPSAAARTAWKNYIIRESSRRTLLIALHFVALCKLFRGWLSACRDDLVLGNRVTYSAHLWKVDNALDFALAWNEKNHFLVKELDFDNLLENAKPDDVDVFGKMLLTGVLGIDDVKAWLYTRGGKL
ncbi:hypothetical protein BU24DRAFT_81470 [Aaosphaeria arxii CBS 175.79]|uniref:Zn(2)-C6 fungal-type domain-containing protein n=1 Tax=Aaosphaeria arxii CBS 175.79 TaxID=1450172 RepID=A0A6A5X9W1_9PLEO|nr:uncharacterized protein BU24DRAFT_81470 [Aaosphaeria arxii CBS 175.79]KAF2009742.1 hypothetical protein BU24DRAFT_81470 [Aaosphaeria arxii CBS 175.79]